MKKQIAYSSFTLVFGLQAMGMTADDTLTQRIEAEVPKDFSGQIVISNLESILYVGNFGQADREANIPVTEDTLFDIGSVTKTYTATAILSLAAQNKLSLDMALSEWFEDLPKVTRAVTLHQLLSHTSGLPQYSGDDSQACDRICFDNWLNQTPLDFIPGEKYSYSNPGYSTLARIIEKVSGEDYETFIREKVVEPLRAGPIGYLHQPDDAAFAIGYQAEQRVGSPVEMGWMDDGPSWHLRGNGGLLTTAIGLNHWLQVTAKGLTLPKEWQVKQFSRHAKRRENAWYGYGWVILDQPWGEVIDHTGGNGYFFADARWFRDRGLLLTITNNAFDREQVQSLLSGMRAALDLAGKE